MPPAHERDVPLKAWLFSRNFRLDHTQTVLKSGTDAGVGDIPSFGANNEPLKWPGYGELTENKTRKPLASWKWWTSPAGSYANNVKKGLFRPGNGAPYIVTVWEKPQ